MNEQHKTTEHIDKVLTQKKALLAQKKAELDLLKNKKVEATKEKIENLYKEYRKLEEMYRKICEEINNINKQEAREENVNTKTELIEKLDNKKNEGIIIHPSKSKIEDLNNRRFLEIEEIMGDQSITADKKEKLIKGTNETYNLLEKAYKEGNL